MTRPEPDPTAADRPRPRPAVLAGLLALTALCSLLPYLLIDRGMSWRAYPWGFSPILPLCLYGAAFLRSRAVAFALPLWMWACQGAVQALWFGDLARGFSPVMVWVYAAIAAAVGFGLLLRRRRGPLRIAGAGLGTGVVFFLVTNFGAWVGGGYPHTPAGLLDCYAAGLPFFRGTLLSLIVFLPALFAPAAVWSPAATGRTAGAAA